MDKIVQRDISADLLYSSPSLIVYFPLFCGSIVPETGSKVLRRIVESLLITHTEAKLNSSGRLVGNNGGNHQNVVWCEGLVRRPVTTLVTAEAAAAVTKATTTAISDTASFR